MGMAGLKIGLANGQALATAAGVDLNLGHKRDITG
jgi:hypothetical protein